MNRSIPASRKWVALLAVVSLTGCGIQAQPTEGDPKAVVEELSRTYDGVSLAEIRDQVSRSQQVIQGTNKGSLLISPERLVPGGQPQVEAFFGGSGHDIISAGGGADYARAGGGADHFIINPGDVPAGETENLAGDEGNDTAVLTAGFSINDVEKRTPPYEVRDPVTGGLYVIDCEVVGVIDPLTLADFPGLQDDTLFQQTPGLSTVFGTVKSSSLHYSASQDTTVAAKLYPGDLPLQNSLISGASVTGDGEVAPVPPNRSPVPSPFGTYPAIFSIESAFLAVGSEQPLSDQELRNSVAVVTLSVSVDSAADTNVQLRLLTEDSLQLKADVQDPSSLGTLLEAMKVGGILTGYQWNPDRTIDLIDGVGRKFVVKPQIFLTRTGIVRPEASVAVMNDSQGRMAFSLLAPNGFAQTFVDISGLALQGQHPFAAAIGAGLVTDAATLGTPFDLLATLPSTESGVHLYPPTQPGIYPFRVQADGGVLYLQSETPLEAMAVDSPVANLNVSISSIFYARRFAHVYLANGERIFAQAGLLNPAETVPKLLSLEASGIVTSAEVTQNLLGPVKYGLQQNGVAKMMPILFGSRLVPGTTAPALAILQDDDSKRFAFGVIDTEGFGQVLVDIGGSTLLPNLPKP